MEKSLKNFALIASLLGLADVVNATVIVAGDDLDGGHINRISYTQNPVDFVVGSGDMFGIRSSGALTSAMADDTVANVSGGGINASDTRGVIGQAKSDNFFGVIDLKNPENPSGTGTATWEFSIIGFDNLVLSIDAGAMGDFEGTEFFTFSVSIDGTPPTDVINFLANTTDSQTYRPLDIGTVTALDDPLEFSGTKLDKTDPATGALDTFTNFISGTGSVLTLTFSAAQDAGSEAFAFDNIVIEGDAISSVPEPSAVILLAIGIAGIGLNRKRCMQNALN